MNLGVAPVLVTFEARLRRHRIIMQLRLKRRRKYQNEDDDDYDAESAYNDTILMIMKIILQIMMIM